MDVKKFNNYILKILGIKVSKFKIHMNSQVQLSNDFFHLLLQIAII
jgi:hypothetical protein